MGQITAAGDTGFPPERLTMQEEIKLTVECLFGNSGLGFVYEHLGIHDHVDRELDTMEDVELLLTATRFQTAPSRLTLDAGFLYDPAVVEHSRIRNSHATRCGTTGSTA